MIKRLPLFLFFVSLIGLSLTAQFAPPTELIADTGAPNSGMGAYRYSFSPVDLNNDGVYHMVGRSTTNQDLDFYINDGSLNFTKNVVDLGVHATTKFFEDFNNDNVRDILIGSEQVLLNDGPLSYDLVWNSQQGPQDEQRVSTGDFNGDGLLDYISLHRFDEQLYYYEAQGGGQFLPTRINEGMSTPGYVISHDYDKDGDLDVVTNADGTFLFYQNDGAGLFSFDKMIDATAVQNSDDSFCALVDLDNDGDEEIIATDISRGIYFLDNEQGTYNTTANYLYDTSNGYVFTMLLDDLNDDGYMDMVSFEHKNDMGSGDVNFINYYENKGDGTFEEPLIIFEFESIIPTFFAGESKIYREFLHCVDIDGNGKKDIIFNDLKASKLWRAEYIGNTPIDFDMDGFLSDVDCDDNNPNVNPGATEMPYNGLDDDCDATTLDDDLDQDGFLMADDCDDNDADINPNATEVPYNGVDEDCNALTLDDDLDQDGFLLADDCNDEDAAINPDAVDIPGNMIDEDCDGMDTSKVEDLLAAQINVYPNPTNNHLNITTELNLLSYEIKNTLGQSVLKGSEVKQIYTGNLNTGKYILYLKDNQGHLLRKPFVRM